MALTKEKIKEFKEQEKKFEDYCSLLTNVAGDIAKAGDKVWAKKVYKKAEEAIDDTDSWSFYDFEALAKGLSENLEDKEWAKKHYKHALTGIQKIDHEEWQVKELQEKLEKLG